MTILITGGLGFVGSHLARKLVNMGQQVVLFDVISHSRLVEDIKDKVKIVQGDLANWAQVLDAVKQNKITDIYHTAALLSAAAEASPMAGYAVNANGTFHVLEACRFFGVKNVMFLSSIASYGPGVTDRVNDDTVQRPNTMYGVTKVFGEILGEYYRTKFGLNFRGVRLPSVIGPGRGPGGASAYSSLIVQEPAASRPYEVFVGEDDKMPLLYIEDAVQSIIQLMQVPEGSLKRRVYNIEGFSPSARQLADSVMQAIPEARISFAPNPDMVRIIKSWPKEMDGNLAWLDWGWRTQYTLDTAVRHFIREFRTHRPLYE